MRSSGCSWVRRAGVGEIGGNRSVSPFHQLLPASVSPESANPYRACPYLTPSDRQTLKIGYSSKSGAGVRGSCVGCRDPYRHLNCMGGGVRLFWSKVVEPHSLALSPLTVTAEELWG